MLIICANPDYTKFSVQHLCREMPFGRKKISVCEPNVLCLTAVPLCRLAHDMHPAVARLQEMLPAIAIQEKNCTSTSKEAGTNLEGKQPSEMRNFQCASSSLNSYFDSPDLLCLMTFKDLALSVKNPSHLFAELPLVRSLLLMLQHSWSSQSSFCTPTVCTEVKGRAHIYYSGYSDPLLTKTFLKSIGTLFF